jgi:hypothetical protein
MRLSLFSIPSVLPSATLYTETSSNTNFQREGSKKTTKYDKLVIAAEEAYKNRLPKSQSNPLVESDEISPSLRLYKKAFDHLLSLLHPLDPNNYTNPEWDALFPDARRALSEASKKL